MTGMDRLRPTVARKIRRNTPENMESAAGNGRDAEASGGASDAGPSFPNRIGFRPIKLQMTLNGVMAA